LHYGFFPVSAFFLKWWPRTRFLSAGFLFPSSCHQSRRAFSAQSGFAGSGTVWPRLHDGLSAGTGLVLERRLFTMTLLKTATQSEYIFLFSDETVIFYPSFCESFPSAGLS